MNIALGFQTRRLLRGALRNKCGVQRRKMEPTVKLDSGQIEIADGDFHYGHLSKRTKCERCFICDDFDSPTRFELFTEYIAIALFTERVTIHR